jgi:hypothetical protein
MLSTVRFSDCGGPWRPWATTIHHHTPYGVWGVVVEPGKAPHSISWKAFEGAR